MSLSQATAYRGIKHLKPTQERHTTEENTRLIRNAILDYTDWGTRNKRNNLERSQKVRNKTKIRQYLYKSMHGTQKTGKFWTQIPGYEPRARCLSCGTTESMGHILTQCTAPHDDRMGPRTKRLAHRNLRMATNKPRPHPRLWMHHLPKKRGRSKRKRGKR